MKYLCVVVLSMIVLCLYSIEIISTDGRLYVLHADSLKEFTTIEITTIREKNDQRKEETWRGIKLTDLINKYGLETAENVEFLANDTYLVRLTPNQISNYDPIIATHRNGDTLDITQLRLVASDMPDMYWVSNLSKIQPFTATLSSNPEKFIPFQTTQSAIRLYDNPHPFVDVKGYRLWDIVTLYSHTSDIYIKLVSNDGIEQTLHFNEYLRDAILIVEETIEEVATSQTQDIDETIDADTIIHTKFHLQSPNMPTGMWQKDIKLIQIKDTAILFKDEDT